MKIKKKICTLALVTFAFAGFWTASVHLQAAEVVTVASPETSKEAPHEVKMEVMDKFPGESDIPNLFVQELTLPERGESSAYFKFELEEESWVYFSGKYSMNNHDGMGTKIRICSDSAYSNEKVAYGWGYGNYDRKEALILPAGTYYGFVQNKHENYDYYKGNVNVTAFAIPTEKIITVEQSLSKNKNKISLVVYSAFGANTQKLQYRPGKIGADSIGNDRYWNNYSWSDTSGDKKAILLELNDENEYRFEVKNNGFYTFNIIDNNKISLVKTIEVKGIDTVKPVIKGVKNKASYNKAVVVKFSDKGTGIKSAKLNGKTIKSGIKVKVKGNYKLEVKDKAGNTATVSFTIK